MVKMPAYTYKIGLASQNCLQTSYIFGKIKKGVHKCMLTISTFLCLETKLIIKIHNIDIED